MSPQFVDFDADGHLDIVTGTYDGSPHIAVGTDDGFKEPTHILDRNGKRLILSQWWDYEAKKWEMGDQHAVAATAFDWDADGDYDLLMGTYGGDLLLHKNEGKAGEPKFAEKGKPVQLGDKALKIDGGLTATRLVDWNDDGLTDFVCGGFQGGVWLFVNTGEKGKPKFESRRTLIAKTANDSTEPFPTQGCYADPVDIDNDGDYDLLVGGYAVNTKSKEKEASVWLFLNQRPD